MQTNTNQRSLSNIIPQTPSSSSQSRPSSPASFQFHQTLCIPGFHALWRNALRVWSMVTHCARTSTYPVNDDDQQQISVTVPRCCCSWWFAPNSSNLRNEILNDPRRLGIWQGLRPPDQPSWSPIRSSSLGSSRMEVGFLKRNSVSQLPHSFRSR